MYEKMDRESSELFVLLLLRETFLRFLAGLPTRLWNNWLPGQRILSVHRPWRKGQLRDKKNKQEMHNVACFYGHLQEVYTWYPPTRQATVYFIVLRF